ncbi:MAG: hypothetical protein ACLFRZ_07620 [Rhodosalinus sp.]
MLAQELLDWIERATERHVSQTRSEPPLIPVCGKGDAPECPRAARGSSRARAGFATARRG